MPRPHSIRPGSRAPGLPQVSALGKACLSSLANSFGMKQSCHVPEAVSPGKRWWGKGQPRRCNGEMGVWEGGCHLQAHRSLRSKTTRLNRTVIWENPPRWEKSSPSVIPRFHTCLQHGMWWCLPSRDVCTEGLPYLHCHVRRSGCQLNREAGAGCPVFENRTPKEPCCSLGMANGSNLTSFSLLQGRRTREIPVPLSRSWVQCPGHKSCLEVGSLASS